MFLNRLQRAALISTDRVLPPHVSGLVYRTMPVVIEAPAVASPLAFVVGVRLGAPGGYSLKDLRRLISAGHKVKEGIAAGRIQRAAETEQRPAEVARDVDPFLDYLAIVNPRVRAHVEAIQILRRVVG